jgi:putative ABC transport system ATP-binding protein
MFLMMSPHNQPSESSGFSGCSGTVINASNLVKHYGEQARNVLNHVSLTVHPGEFVALMGASGCGKSTLLNILGAIDSPNSGTLNILGESIENKAERDLTRFRQQKLGFVFQFFNLMATLTAKENVALPLELAESTTPREQNRLVDQMLEQVGMSHRAKFYPAQLSGGEMQRIAIARALIHSPALILADEPTGNLDTENGAMILNLLKSLTTQNRQTILMATHSPEASACASRVIYMKDGQIQV